MANEITPAEIIEAGALDEAIIDVIRRNKISVEDVRGLVYYLNRLAQAEEIQLEDAIDSQAVDTPITNAVKRIKLAIADVNGLQDALDAKLEEVPNADENTVGGIRVRVDSGSQTVFITTDGSAP